MKIKNYLLIALLTLTTLVSAQRVPTHPQGVKITAPNASGVDVLSGLKTDGTIVKSTIAIDSVARVNSVPTLLSQLIDDIGADESEIIKITEKYQIVNKDLDPTKVYLLLNDITLNATDRIRVNNLQLLYGLGHDIVTISTTEPNSVIFEHTGVGSKDIKIYNLSLSAAGIGSTAFNVKDATGAHEVRLRGVNFNGCESIGTFDGYRQGFWDDIGFYGCKNGLVLKNAWNGFKIFNSNIFGFSNTGTFIKEGENLTFSNRLFLNLNFDFPIGSILTDLKPSNFLDNELFQINSSIAKRNNTLDISNAEILIPNLSANSLASLWIGNIGLPDTATEVYVKDVNVSGTYTIDWLKDTYRLNLTGDTTFNEINIPASGKNTQEIKLYLSGNFTPTFPANWLISQVGTYKGTDLNQVTIKFVEDGVYFTQISNTLTQYPSPRLGTVVPAGLLPNTTAELILNGSFFTPESIVSITGQVINSIEFDDNTGALILSVTTGSIEGDFDIFVSNGAGVTFQNRLVIALGEVYLPNPTDWVNVAEPINLETAGEARLKTALVIGTAEYSQVIDYTKRVRISFVLKASPLQTTIPVNGDYNVIEFRNVSDSSINFYIGLRAQGTRYYFLSNTYLGFLQQQELNDGSVKITIDFKDGFLTVFKNDVIKYNVEKTLTENLKLFVRVRDCDITQIKYIELAN